MIKLSKLNLELAFVSTGALSENIQDEPRAIKHTTLQHAFQIALLRRTQRVIEEHDFSLKLNDQGGNFRDLATAGIKPGIGSLTRTRDNAEHLHICRSCQQLELVQVFILTLLPQLKMNQNGALTTRRALKVLHAGPQAKLG
jgi:hypothetical protein